MKAILPFSIAVVFGISVAIVCADDRDSDSSARRAGHSGRAADGSIMYVPTQFYRTSEYTIYYGYKARPAWLRSQSLDSFSRAPAETIITAEANLPQKIVSAWRRKLSNSVEREREPKRVTRHRSGSAESVVQVVEKELAPVTERSQEFPADGTAREEERTSKAGRMEPLEKLDDQIKNEPENGSAYYFRGSLWHEKLEYQRAIEDFSEALRIDPKNSVAYYKRGLCYVALNRPDLALEDFAQANRLAPKNNRAWSLQSGEWMRQRGY